MKYDKAFFDQPFDRHGTACIKWDSMEARLGEGINPMWVADMDFVCPDEITKYLGITLLPQAGVALGMSVIAKELLPGMEGELIRNLSLFSVLIYELAGPLMTKIALTKAGNIDPKTPTPRGLAKAAKKAAK